jgi:hypothetical protein
MRPRAFPAAAALAFAAGAAALAPGCTVPETNYGAPSSLGPKTVPDPTYPAAAPDAGEVNLSTLCSGKPPASDPGCAVKWPAFYEKYVKAAGTWNCADANCHGEGPQGRTPQVPAIPADPAKAYDSLVQHKVTGKRYINPCSKNPDDSSFLCNVTGGCGPVMPPAGGVTPAQLDELKAWLTCGAPKE